MNVGSDKLVCDGSSFYEKAHTPAPIGSALGADKKINLASWIYVIVHVWPPTWTSAQGRSVDVRGDGFHFAHRDSVARLTDRLWPLEFGLHALAALVPERLVGKVAGRVGPQGRWAVALSGYQPCQSASRCEQPRWRPAKSGDWTYQRWLEHPDQCLGGWWGPSRQFVAGRRPATRCAGGAKSRASEVAWHGHGGRQGVRQQRISETVAPLGQPCLHPTPLQPPERSNLAAEPLPETPQGGELIPTVETLSQNRHSL